MRLGVERGEQDPEQVGQGPAVGLAEPAEQRVLAAQEIGQGRVNPVGSGRGQRDQDPAAVLRVGLPGTRAASASRSTRLVIVPEVTSVAWSSAPGLS